MVPSSVEVKGSARFWATLFVAVSVALIVTRQFWVGQRQISRSPREGWRHKSTDGLPWREREGETAFVSEGDLFQEDGCPYTLSRRQAAQIMNDDSEVGNTITLVTHGGGRAGNHYMTLSAYFAMGFCCRSKLLSLPAGDTRLPDDGEKFTAQQRWFDFSNVTLPWPQFQGMGDDPAICRPETKDGGSAAFGYEKVHWQLLQCMNRVYLRGCEKAYLGSLVDTEAFCPKAKRKEGAGSLVVHIRSGDIFDPKGEGSRRDGFGQPPLQYYLHVLRAKDWDDVTILTASWQDSSLNPTFNMLDMLADAGTLGKNVRLFKNRSLLTDVREMLCADALATSRSSMSFLTFAHTRANVFFVPSPCGKGSFRRMKNPPVKATFDNTTLLLLERPYAEVFGINWREDGSDYSVYQAWHDNHQQLLEMATYKGIEGVPEVRSWHDGKGEAAFVSEGDLVQVEGCPYALSMGQAEQIMSDDNKVGNTITLVDHGKGRAGNHYMTLSAYLAMGFCCRSKLLTLPAGDTELADEGEQFTAQRRWFDFSNVTLPWPQFQGMGDDPAICRPETKDGGRAAFGYENVQWQLLQCMNRVYLRGCEKAYLGSLVDTEAFCPKAKRKEGAGSLVMHVRSGDIFDPWGEGSRREGFGQPPLQYYLHVLRAKDWDDVTILTASWQDSSLNPTFNMLDMLADAGTLGKNVRLFKNRSLLTDVREMLCADALATSRSSMSFLTFAHTRANVFFVPSPCGKGSFRRMKNPPVKATFDNTTLLLLERPYAEVFGINWREDGSDYSVYQAWHDNHQQLLEMATYRGIEGLRNGSGSKRIVKVDGESYLMPSCVSLTTKGGTRHLRVVVPLLAGSCSVNGMTVSKHLAMTYCKPDLTIECLLVFRALRDILTSKSGPSQSKIHKIHAAYVMQAFDVEHPNASILDTDVVLVRHKRRAYVMESSFLAGDLRQCDRLKEFNLLASALSRNTPVMSGALEPAPEVCEVENAATARDLLDPGVMRAKRARVVSIGPRTVTCDDGTCWKLPAGVYCLERNFHRRLVFRVFMTKGSCEVNGRTIRRTVKVSYQSSDVAVSKRNILALRAVREELFPVDEPARNQIHEALAAIILRTFDRDYPESDVRDQTIVHLRVNRHRFVKESSFVAGDLRTTNKNTLSILTERFLNDPVVMAGELEPASASPPVCEGSAPHNFVSKAARHAPETDAETGPKAPPTTTPCIWSAELPNAAVVGTKSPTIPSLPRCIYTDSGGGNRGTTMRLKVKLGAMCVNGEEVVPAKKTKVVGGIAMTAGNIAALSCLRDDFALGLGASQNVRRIIAAKAFRLWLRRRRASEIMDSLPVNITDASTKLAADGVQTTFSMTAGQLRGVEDRKSGVLQELLMSLGATDTIQQCGSQHQPVVAVAEDGPSSSGASEKRSKNNKKRKREDGGNAAVPPAGKSSLERDEQRRVDSSSRDNEGGESVGEQRSVRKRARKGKRKTGGTSAQDQPAQELETTNGAKKKRERMAKSSERVDSGVDEVGADVAVALSTGRPDHQGAASCSAGQKPPRAKSNFDKTKNNGLGDSTPSSSASGTARQNSGDNRAASPKWARKKRNKAAETAMRPTQPAQHDGSTEPEMRTMKRKKTKKTAFDRVPKSSHGGQEGGMQENAATSKDGSVIHPTSGASATHIKKRKKGDERSRCLHNGAQSAGAEEGGKERTRRTVAIETLESSSNGGSETPEGSPRRDKQPANSTPDSRRTGTKKKGRSRERKETWKASDDQAHSNTAMLVAEHSGRASGPRHSNSLVGIGSQQDSFDRKTARSAVDLASDCSSRQDRGKKKGMMGDEKGNMMKKKQKNQHKKNKTNQ
eukprot:g10964.t1